MFCNYQNLFNRKIYYLKIQKNEYTYILLLTEINNKLLLIHVLSILFHYGFNLCFL